MKKRDINKNDIFLKNDQPIISTVIYGKEERFLRKQNQNEINESKYGHVSLSTDLRNVEDYSAHVCLDAVVFHNPPSDVKGKVSHKN